MNDEFITGVVAGTFDLIHPGHVVLLRQCRAMCNHLTVALHVDPSIERPQKNKPIMTVFERWAVLNAMDDVSTIIPYETERDLVNMYSAFTFGKLFVGADHIKDTVTGSHLFHPDNIIYVPRNHGWSSSELRSRISR